MCASINCVVHLSSVYRLLDAKDGLRSSYCCCFAVSVSVVVTVVSVVVVVESPGVISKAFPYL